MAPAVANKNTGAGGPTDTTVPTVTAAPAGGSFTGPVTNVTLTASEPSSIVYTLDGSDPLIAASENPNAINYSAPFTISDKDANGAAVASVTLRYVAIDAGGNPSLARTEVYKFGAAPAPGAPTGVRATAGNTTADVTWTAPAVPSSSPITGYKITATTGTSTTPVASATAISSATTVSLTGLTNGTTYTVSVVATNATGDSPAGTATVTPSATEVLTATAPTNKTNDFRVRARATRRRAACPCSGRTPPGIPLATSTLTAAAAPATGSTFDLRARTTIAAGTKLIIVGTNGGKLPITA